MRLSLKITLLVISAALTSGLAVAAVYYVQASLELRHAAEDKLLALLQARTIAIRDYLSSIERDLKSEAANPFVAEALSSFIVARDDLGDNANAVLRSLYINKNPYPPDQRSKLDLANGTSLYSLTHTHFHPVLRRFIESYGYRDLLLLDLDGNVVYSVRKQDDFAVPVARSRAGNGGLVSAYRLALSSASAVFVDFAAYSPSGGEATGFVAAQVRDDTQHAIGVLVLEMPVDRINQVMQVAVGLGHTGETLIVGPDLRLRSASRLDRGSTILAQTVDIDGLSEAFNGPPKVIRSRQRHYDGSAADVLVAYEPLDFLGTRWVVAAKVDLDEVDAPVREMRDKAAVNGIVVSLLVALVGLVITRRSVVRPLNQVIGAVTALATGDRDAPLRLPRRGDEIGGVSRALVLFRTSLIERDQLAEEKQREALEEGVALRTQELATARQVAEAANRAKSDFLSSVSHELRTPLNAIIGFTEYVLENEDEPLTAEQAASLSQVHRAGQHLLLLINDVLDLSKIEAGALSLSIEPVDSRQIIDDCVLLMSSFAAGRNVTLRNMLTAAELPAIEADRIRFKQVFLNLLSNAIKYNRDPGTVVIERGKTAADALRIGVRDTGLGIPEDQLDLLFQPFERLGAANSTIEGTGIGLAISKRLIEEMGGQILVESTVDQGSTFSIEMPLSQHLS